MGRSLRIDIPGVPQHVVQRGNNRFPCFQGIPERWEAIRQLGRALERHPGTVHAFALMPNHVHLVVTPIDAGGVGRMMQRFSRNFAAWFNWRHQRTGSLWEGRYRARHIETDAYFIACCRYVDLNPVRARIVGDACEYPWSSAATNALGREHPWVRPATLLAALDTDETRARAAYRRLLTEAMPPAQIERIREDIATQPGRRS